MFSQNDQINKCKHIISFLRRTHNDGVQGLSQQTVDKTPKRWYSAHIGVVELLLDEVYIMYAFVSKRIFKSVSEKELRTFGDYKWALTSETFILKHGFPERDIREKIMQRGNKRSIIAVVEFDVTVDN